MADALSHSSVDSAGDEYVIVNGEPRLRIPNNGQPLDVEKRMQEILESDESKPLGVCTSSDGQASSEAKSPAISECSSIVTVDPPYHTEECSVYKCVVYLGSATMNAPNSELEIMRNMQALNDHSHMAMTVNLSVPQNCEGSLLLLDPANNSSIASFVISSIRFCVRGPSNTKEQNCFAFTFRHGDSDDTALYQCHVFRCDPTSPTNVGQILYSLVTSFRKKSMKSLPSVTSPCEPGRNSIKSEDIFKFNVAVDIKEDDGKGGYSSCPKDKNVFKLRKDVEKKLVITVCQVSSNRELVITRCFGLLISPGRQVRHSDMQLIDLDSMGSGSDGRSYTISGQWDPREQNFQILNTLTEKDTRVFMTLAVDLVIEGIQEPVRFVIATKAKIYPTTERFFYFVKKSFNEQFILVLKAVENIAPEDIPQYEVVTCRSQTEIDNEKAHLSLNLSNTATLPEDIPTPGAEQDESEMQENLDSIWWNLSDNDEPLMSGSGIVSKEVTDEDMLDSWREALTKWHQNLSSKPKQVTSLVRKGVPEALRGEVWQLLAGCQDNSDMLEAYRILLTKDSSCEPTILRDINRTFPAHDYFRETGGLGQDALYKISKAYSIYDEEIGYCQGISFLAAALLLHMPEEQAFCVLVKIMFDYSMRDLFKQGFDNLHLKFYQLERLLQDQIPELYEHFVDLGLEAHMYASQWFLTLFTAKFPLFMVYHILDLFLSEGQDVIFRVALALLKTSRKDILALDFEGVLKYFRVHLPKKYRSEENARDLINTAVYSKMSSRKLKKYEKEYQAIKEAKLQQLDPTERLEDENKRLTESNMRLERENDDLAHELVTSKIALRNDLDASEDRGEILNKELLQTKSQLLETEEEKKRLEQENKQLKQIFRDSQEKADGENTRNQAIIGDYKQICSQLSEKLEKQSANHKQEMLHVKKCLESCTMCKDLISSEGLMNQSHSSCEHPLSDPLSSAASHQADADRQASTIRELELELAQTKLALVESECRVGDLTHELNGAINEIQESKNTWLHKTLSSLKEVTSVKDRKDSKGEGSGLIKSQSKDSGLTNRKDQTLLTSPQ